jgi:hypothetical protein
MSERFDDNGHLGSMLGMLPAPEPSGQLAAAARHRYLAAIEARARREALVGLVAALIGLAGVAVLVGTVIEPAALVAWLAEATADLARWTAGTAVVMALVPAAVWGPLVLGLAATVLALARFVRIRSVALAK